MSEKRRPPDLASPLRAVLLGDAAHAMTPNLGQGAGQGIEDAATLVALLRGAGSAELTERLARYSALRCPRTAAILRRSRAVGKTAQAANPVFVSLRDLALTLMPGGVMGAVSTRVQRWQPPG
ncbi:hypothetical protein G7067_03950 [Leucobacter insecticola]|uniref:FAD-binding domain-containing protein n=1 Tax=Leucobacter insecticola TaxID=2714934 RepID=A0A6G8FHK5_9MICO|nr:FAD-dependent monooxygenase [Leucobacter insecticola]QIM15759.1 hypothetical protein G7067_03950 [Leucobacter insecticola]